MGRIPRLLYTSTSPFRNHRYDEVGRWIVLNDRTGRLPRLQGLKPILRITLGLGGIQRSTRLGCDDLIRGDRVEESTVLEEKYDDLLSALSHRQDLLGIVFDLVLLTEQLRNSRGVAHDEVVYFVV